MKSNGEQAADPARCAAENVNLDDPQSARKGHVQHRGGKHSLQLHHLRERHCAPNRACLHERYKITNVVVSRNFASASLHASIVVSSSCIQSVYAFRFDVSKKTTASSTGRRVGPTDTRATCRVRHLFGAKLANETSKHGVTAIQSGPCGVPRG